MRVERGGAACERADQTCFSAEDRLWPGFPVGDAEVQM